MKGPSYGFDEIWLCDFEYQPVEGDLPKPICMVATELNGGRTIRLNAEELAKAKTCPFNTGDNALFVSHYLPAELSCFHALGWALPKYCFDSFVEFRNLTNGLDNQGASLLATLLYFGLDAMAASEKKEMRQLAIRGGPYSKPEMAALLDYCESDVIALKKLFPKILERTSLVHALQRGRYMVAVSNIEKHGTPIDGETLELLRRYWEPIKTKLVSRIDKNFGFFEGQTFKRDKFEQYLVANNHPWPRTESGTLALDEDTFREMIRVHTHLAPIKELRHALSQMRLNQLSVGYDHRNRTSLAPFRARTSRNQPSNTEFIFGPSCWLRGLIRPPPGYSIAYIDWSQQEFGIAAALSGDPKMQKAYLSGDPYLEFAKQAGAVPQDATKKSHAPEREQFKACVLAVQYGMGEDSLAARIGQPRAQARHLLKLHLETYRVFWAWSDRVVNHAMLKNELQTTFGWKIHVGQKPNERSLRNFPMQANGAEMLRLACCLLTEADIGVCAPVHDAILVMAPMDKIEIVVAESQHLMEEASRVVLDGFKLRSDAKIVTYPERYMDPRGVQMWKVVNELLDEIKVEGGVVNDRSVVIADTLPVTNSATRTI